jgi:flavodoxin
MTEQKICQSCSASLTKPENFGTNLDSSINQDYCSECYQQGQFVELTLTRDLIQQKVAQRLIAEKKLSQEKALEEARLIVSHLKRWGLPQPKSIIYYYSKTGNSCLVAEILSRLLKADLEEIKEIEPINIQGFINHLKQGRLSLFGRIIEVLPVKNLPANYELVILVNPVWGFSIPYPVRSFLRHLPQEKNKLLLFLTHEGLCFQRTFRQLRKTLASFNLLGELAIQSPRANPQETEKIIKDFLARSLR